MGKRACWFGWFRKLFISEEKPKTEKKLKRWRLILGRLKFKQRPVLLLPSPQRAIDKATEKQRKFAVTVALATAAAAEAAVAAAQAAAEVVRLTGSSQSCHHHHHHHFTKKDEHMAAIKIQSAFRAYLARKALRALKGLVRLQAIVRGQAVRRQVVMKSKHLPSNAKMRTQVQAKSISNNIDGETKQLFKSNELGDVDGKGKNLKKDPQLVQMLECKSQRCWDYSMLSKEDMETLWFKRQKASIKRDRMMKYSLSHRERTSTQMLEESLPHKETNTQSLWLEQFSNKEAYTREGLENLKSAGDLFGGVQIKTRSTRKQDSIEGLNSPVLSFPRRSFCRTKRSTTSGDDSSVLNCPVFPTYMAATESARAKARSMSTPRQRIGIHDDTCFDHSLLSKNGLSLWSSYNGEMFDTWGKSFVALQRAPASINRH